MYTKLNMYLIIGLIADELNREHSDNHFNQKVPVTLTQSVSVFMGLPNIPQARYLFEISKRKTNSPTF